MYFGKINFETNFRPFRGQLEVRNICGLLVATVMENHFDFEHFSLAITCDDLLVLESKKEDLVPKLQIWHQIF